MPSDKTVAPLLRISLFYGLSPQQLGRIAREAEKLKFRPGDKITEAGEAGDGAIVVVSGTAELIAEPASSEPPEVVEPGSMIGELAMLVERQFTSTVVARDAVLCLKIPRAALLAHMLEDPSLAEQLARRMASRLQQLAQKLRRIDLLLHASAPHVPAIPGAGPVLGPAATGGS